MPKKILIINTGGTLSSVKSSKGLVPGMRSDDMLEELRMVSRNLELETEDFCSLDSANIGPKDWSGLAEMIARKSYDYQGIVVIHGTDWMFVWLLWKCCTGNSVTPNTGLILCCGKWFVTILIS